MSNPLNTLLSLYPDPMTAEDVQGLISGTHHEVQGYLTAGTLVGTQTDGVWTIGRANMVAFIGAHQYRAEAPFAQSPQRFALTVGMIATARARALSGHPASLEIEHAA